jgi:4-hydroxy-tetrahydrodipicolinate synthase
MTLEPVPDREPPAGDGAVFLGVGAALVTFFQDDGAVDAAATADHAAHLADAGITAVLVAGTTGEAATLSRTERAALVSAVRDRVPSQVPVIAGTGAASARQAVVLTAQAIDAGADAVLVLSPPHAHDCRPYYEAVTAEAHDTPVLAYHFPAMSPPGIPVEVLRELPVQGLKDSSGDATRLIIEADELPVGLYPGNASMLSLAGSIGCSGAIVALANVDPDGCLRAFGGDGECQRELINGHRHAALAGIAGLKRALNGLYGTSTVTRIP